MEDQDRSDDPGAPVVASRQLGQRRLSLAERLRFGEPSPVRGARPKLVRETLLRGQKPEVLSQVFRDATLLPIEEHLAVGMLAKKTTTLGRVPTFAAIFARNSSTVR